MTEPTRDVSEAETDLWVELERDGRAERRGLGPDPLVISGFGGLVLEAAGADRLTLSGRPVRAVFDGEGEAPRRQGQALPAGAPVVLDVGDELVWRGARVRLGRAEATLEALAPEALETASPRTPVAPGAGAVGSPAAWRRVKAGLLVELGLADRRATRSIQDDVIEKRFDPDEAAARLLADAAVEDDDGRLEQRTARLMRDLVMAPAQRGARGAARRAREAGRSGLAWIVGQFLVVGVVAALLFVLLLLLRWKLGWSVDGALDGLLELLPSEVTEAAADVSQANRF